MFSPCRPITVILGYCRQLIKSGFSRTIPKNERLSAVRKAAGERGVWKRRFWEHCIRDNIDYQRYLDYVHVNPLKHDLVTHAQDWPYSSFHRYVTKIIYPSDWCGDMSLAVDEDD